MSLESEIKNLTAAIQANTAAVNALLQSGQSTIQANAQQVVAVTAAAVAPAPAVVTTPAVQSAPVSVTVTNPVASQPVVAATPVTTPAVQMPTPPVFQAPTAAVPDGLPFSDAAGVMAYTMEKYGKLGKDKGAKIQDVLTALGLTLITDLKPEQYAHFYAGVEAIQ